MTDDNTEYVKTLPEAIKKATFADYENGMATKAFTIQKESCYLKVIRKAGSLDHPPIMLFKAIPINGNAVDYGELSNDIIEALDLYGDLELNFQGETIKTAVIPMKIV